MVSALPVVDEHAVVLGVVAEADLLLCDRPRPHDRGRGLDRPRRHRARGGSAHAYRRLKRLPVVDKQGRLVGILVQGVRGVVRVENQLAYDIDDIDVGRLMTYPWVGS